MDNGSKVTPESRKFIASIIREYIKMGPEKTRINIKISNVRTRTIGNNTINVSVLSQEEANMLRIMQESELEKAQEDPTAVWDRVLAPYYKKQGEQEEKDFFDSLLDDFDVDKTRAEVNKNKSEKERFKESLKYNIEEHENDSNRKEQTNQKKKNIKKSRNEKNYKLDKNNSSNMTILRRILAFLGVVLFTYSTGSVAHDIGRAKEYVKNSGHKTIEGATDDLEELLKLDFEKRLEKELGKDITVIAEAPFDGDDLFNPHQISVKDSDEKKEYKIPKEMEKILDGIPSNIGGYIPERIRLCDLLDYKRKIEKYFEENDFAIEEGKEGSKDKIIQIEKNDGEVR